MTTDTMTLEQAARLVQQFHETFGLYLNDCPAAQVPAEILATRVRLMQEELDEYREAATAGDMVGIADALTDMLYVLLGTYVTHGLQVAAEDLMAEVHRSNMTKLDTDGRPIIKEGKVRKSALFSEPVLAPIIARYQEECTQR